MTFPQLNLEKSLREAKTDLGSKTKNFLDAIGLKFSGPFGKIGFYGTLDFPLFLDSDIADIFEEENTYMKNPTFEMGRYKVPLKGQPGHCLLTQWGLQKACWMSQSEPAKQLQDFVVTVLETLRKRGEVTIASLLEEKKVTETTLAFMKSEREYYFSETHVLRDQIFGTDGSSMSRLVNARSELGSKKIYLYCVKPPPSHDGGYSYLGSELALTEQGYDPIKHDDMQMLIQLKGTQARTDEEKTHKLIGITYVASKMTVAGLNAHLSNEAKQCFIKGKYFFLSPRQAFILIGKISERVTAQLIPPNGPLPEERIQYDKRLRVSNYGNIGNTRGNIDSINIDSMSKNVIKLIKANKKLETKEMTQSAKIEMCYSDDDD